MAVVMGDYGIEEVRRTGVYHSGRNRECEQHVLQNVCGVRGERYFAERSSFSCVIVFSHDPFVLTSLAKNSFFGMTETVTSCLRKNGYFA